MAADRPANTLAARQAARFDRVILFVHDVDRLAQFYADMLGAPVVEAIDGEWVVLDGGACQLALHRVGMKHRAAGPPPSHRETNTKLVFTVVAPLEAIHAELVGKGVSIGPIERFAGAASRHCDGRDPEGNVFQLVEATED